MKLTLEPLRQHKATFNLKLSFDDSDKIEQQDSDTDIPDMAVYERLATARKRVDAFITRNGLCVDSDNTTVSGVDMIVYHDVNPQMLENLLEPRPLILDELDLQNFDGYTH